MQLVRCNTAVHLHLRRGIVIVALEIFAVESELNVLLVFEDIRGD
jgi:hypothetical protein